MRKASTWFWWCILWWQWKRYLSDHIWIPMYYIRGEKDGLPVYATVRGTSVLECCHRWVRAILSGLSPNLYCAILTYSQPTGQLRHIPWSHCGCELRLATQLPQKGSTFTQLAWIFLVQVPCRPKGTIVSVAATEIQKAREFRQLTANCFYVVGLQVTWNMVLHEVKRWWMM